MRAVKPKLPPRRSARPCQRQLKWPVGPRRAEALLRLGLVDEALSDISAALAIDSSSSDVHALRAVIQIAKNEKTAALESANQAIASNPDNFRAWLSLSYAQQASFQLERALESAKKAQALRADSSLLQARAAELYMSLGIRKGAEKAARVAVNSNPDESHAHTILGFVHLANSKIEAASESFARAIDRDSFDALPRLGLGLALIREGKLLAGREQVEIAVALDPGSALLRSYVGKAYYEENVRERDDLAAVQFSLAKELDPADPTPWFYDAVLKQTQNLPIAALRDLDHSIDLNDNRVVYRSRLLLDEDLAARNAQLARTFRELGFDQLAQTEAYRSMSIATVDFSAHRLLADALLGRPRHHIARVSELLQSQMWQPLNVAPVDAQLIDDRSFVLRNAGPATTGFNEYNPLFVQQGIHLQASGITGENDTIGDQILLSGIHGRASASIGQYYYDSDGFQEGWGLKKNIANAFIQGEFSSNSSVFGEYRNTDQTQGDLSQNFFGVTNSQRFTQERELYRLGFRSELGSLKIAGAFGHQSAQDATEFPVGSLLFTSDNDESAGELLGAYEAARIDLLFGVGYYDIDGVTRILGSRPHRRGRLRMRLSMRDSTRSQGW